MKLLSLLLACSMLSGCAGWNAYNSTVASRSDSLSGYGKGSNYGGAYTHSVTYR